MNDGEFKYKGKKVVIREDHPNAVISVDGREFSCHHHHEKDNVGLAMWMCEESYFASPDIQELAKHFVDYGYLFDAPGRVRVDNTGKVIQSGEHEHEPGQEHEQGHEHGKGK